jgi:Sporulation and spore germination
VTRRGVAALAGAIVVVGLFAWGLTVSLERVIRPPADPTPASADAPDRRATPVRHITATLFIGASDAQHLIQVQREVPFGEGPIEQGRQIVLAQLTAAAEAPLVRAIPPGASLRSFYISERGEAFVDLGPEIVSAHPGGSTAEQLTVYAIVNAVVINLPAVTSVQLLINGKEADTLAGHVDIRRTLRRNDSIIRNSN